MRKASLLLVLIAALFLEQEAAVAQFVNGQNANVVLGQPDFTTGTSATTSSGMNNPRGVAVDPTTGKVFVADASNNRVLRFSSVAAAISGSAAEAVLGQPNFTSSGSATTQSGMYYPTGVAVEASGNLYVAEQYNNRVLKFANAASLTNGANATSVLGEPDFTTNSGGITTQNGMNYPAGVAIDASGNLYVADPNNNRVLKFANAASAANGSNATSVLGQPNFTSNAAATTQIGMSTPEGVAVDASGNLYAADFSNQRVLRFANAASLANGANATSVLGEPDFTTSIAQVKQNGMYYPLGVVVDGLGNLYVADQFSCRVLRFANAASLANGANATSVLGEPNFTTYATATTQSGMNYPSGVAVDATGNLYVADQNNNRVLRFNTSVLPVELTAFTATPFTNGVLLAWQTATEKNNAGFDVERSSDNAAFSKIGFVKGNGTTTQSHSYSFTDNAASGKAFYRLKQTDYDGKFEYSKTVEVGAGTPKTFTLSQNYPNPFNPTTVIGYQLAVSSVVTLKVYDVLGREVATLVNERKAAGTYTASFNAAKYSSGVYFYKLQAGDFVQTKKMLLVK
jgi:DNA-binding beta-propeller fold protein YncE